MENNNFNYDPILNQYESSTYQPPKKIFFEFNADSYLNTKLPTGVSERKTKIRFLPISKDKLIPFEVIYTHSIKVGNSYKTIPCNKKTVEYRRNELRDTQNLIDSIPHFANGNPQEQAFYQDKLRMVDLLANEIQEYIEKYGDTCAFCDVEHELFQQSKRETLPNLKKQYLDTSRTLSAKQTYIARVIERGKEEHGPKFFKYNASYTKKGLHDSLIEQYTENKNYGIDIFDLTNGCDITLKIVTNQQNKAVLSPSIIVDRFQTALTQNPQQLESWINDERTWVDMYRPKPYIYSKILLNDDTPIFDKETQTYVGQKELQQRKEQMNEVIREEELRIAQNYQHLGNQNGSYSTQPQYDNYQYQQTQDNYQYQPQDNYQPNNQNPNQPY